MPEYVAGGVSGWLMLDGQGRLFQWATQDARSYWKQAASCIRGGTGHYRGQKAGKSLDDWGIERRPVCLRLVKVKMYGRRWGLRSRQASGHLSLCGTLVECTFSFFPAKWNRKLWEDFQFHSTSSDLGFQAMVQIAVWQIDREREKWRQRDQLRVWHSLIFKLMLWGRP